MPCRLVPFGVDYQKCWQTRYSEGLPYRVWAPYGMPRIPDHLLTTVFYLYRNTLAARKGLRAGGTGFFVSLKSTWPPLAYHVYAVSNQHVVCNSPVIRLNTTAGDTRTIPLDAIDWEPHPHGDDISVAPIELLEMDEAFQDVDINFVSVTDDSWALKDRLAEYQIGIGDDVFMIGRFMPHDGQLSNHPSMRFGHISMMPDPQRKIPQPDRGNFTQESYCIDMHSLFGYSGSPVFVYRTASGLGKLATPPRFAYLLLGVHWGSIWDQVEDKQRNKEIHTHGGINGVVPIWKLWDLLHIPKLVKLREEEIMKHKEKFPSAPGGAVLESAKDDDRNVAKVRDETLRTMLATPPQPRKQGAAKRVKSK